MSVNRSNARLATVIDNIPEDATARGLSFTVRGLFTILSFSNIFDLAVSTVSEVD